MTDLLTTLTPTESRFEMHRRERTHKSKFSEAEQVVSSPTGLWVATLKFKNLRRADAQSLISKLWSLRGATGSFALFDWSAPSATGEGGKYQITDYQHALPGKIAIDTGKPQNTVIARAGDYVSIDGELKGLVEDVVADHLGHAALFFEPFMRTPVTMTTQANFDKPTGVFRLKPGYKVPRHTSKKLVLAELTIDCIERVTI
ncbi:hypothetical protein ACWX0P_27400 [Vibrio mediterranei]